jgi:hypothetical protein
VRLAPPPTLEALYGRGAAAMERRVLHGVRGVIEGAPGAGDAAVRSAAVALLQVRASLGVTPERRLG